DLDSVTEIPGSTIREIDREAKAFNSMLQALRAFSTYVPRTLVRNLLQLGIDNATRSREAVVTVMFTDIAGFTSLAAQMAAPEAAEVLNRHFQLLVVCIDQQNGTVDKFIGDGLLAFWGPPDQDPNHADAACQAALAIARAIAADNRNAA